MNTVFFNMNKEQKKGITVGDNTFLANFRKTSSEIIDNLLLFYNNDISYRLFVLAFFHYSIYTVAFHHTHGVVERVHIETQILTVSLKNRLLFLLLFVKKFVYIFFELFRVHFLFYGSLCGRHHFRRLHFPYEQSQKFYP